MSARSILAPVAYGLPSASRQLRGLETRLPQLERTAAAAQESLGRGELSIAASAHVQSNSLAARAEAIRLRASLEQAQAALGVLLALPF